jgi:Rrf2 family protein
MLRLSKKIDYGLILLRDLCQGQTALSAREIAEKYRLPASMAANILKALASAGILTSQRGALGGYVLSRHPGRISLAEIVEALEGPFLLVDCVSDDACCQFSPVCPTHDPMQAVHRKFKEFMMRLSLEEIFGMQLRPIAFEVQSDENAYLPG